MTYRNDLAAAMQRAQALEQELSRQQSQATTDREQVAALQAQLAAAHQEIGRLSQSANQPPPPAWGPPGQGYGGYGAPAYGAPGYGAGGYGPPGYSAGGYGYPSYAPSQANTILILGILSIVVCSLLGPFAWHMGNQEMERLEAGHIDPNLRSNIVAGRVCGIIGTVLVVVSVLFFVFAFMAAGASAM